MLPLEKKSRPFPRWIEWLLVVAMLGLAFLEFTHGEQFWAGLFVVLAVTIAATSFLVKRNPEDSHGR